MQGNFLASVIAVAVGATLGVSIPAAAQTAPPMGGGYKDVVPIPVDDPTTKAIAGALFKPAGKGPFPVVVYMSGCYGLGLNNPPGAGLGKDGDRPSSWQRHVATFIVDPFTPRNEPEGVCAKLNNDTLAQYFTRGGNDAVAALKVVKSLPDIDPNRVFLQGYSFGAISSLFAVDPNTPGARDPRVKRGSSLILRLLLDNVASSSSNARSSLARRTTGRRRRFARRSATSQISVTVFELLPWVRRLWARRSSTWALASPITKRPHLVSGQGGGPDAFLDAHLK